MFFVFSSYIVISSHTNYWNNLSLKLLMRLQSQLKHRNLDFVFVGSWDVSFLSQILTSRIDIYWSRSNRILQLEKRSQRFRFHSSIIRTSLQRKQKKVGLHDLFLFQLFVVEVHKSKLGQNVLPRIRTKTPREKSLNSYIWQ